MFTELTLGDVERVRLILRGGTVIDWRRLNISSINDCKEMLRVNEIDLDDERDAARLSDIHHKAVDYLEHNFGFTFISDITHAPHASDLMLLAAGHDPVLQPQACMVLKLMHIISTISKQVNSARYSYL